MSTTIGSPDRLCNQIIRNTIMNLIAKNII